MDWRDEAYCKDTDPSLFFDDTNKNLAKAYCRLCEVQQECLDYAINNSERYGVYGGLDPSERSNLSISSLLAKRRDSSQQNNKHEQKRPANVAPFSPVSISSRQNHKQEVLENSAAWSISFG